jgi:dihydrofolate reductase
MSKLIMWNLISLDGFFEGPESWALDWLHAAFSDEQRVHSIEQLRSAELLLFGRTTYEGMAAYWPTAQDEGEIAALMNGLPKVVFSRTLERADWKNTKLVRGDPVSEVRDLKRRGQGDIFVFGSAELSASLMEHGLFDEYRIGIVPIVLGKGNPLFGRGGNRLRLTLLDVRALSSGVVILRYAPPRDAFRDVLGAEADAEDSRQ